MPNYQYTLHSIDNGSCRVYYKHNRKGGLFCLQEENLLGEIQFLMCSKDGEPSHPVFLPLEGLPNPQGDSDIEIAARKYLQQHDQYIKMKYPNYTGGDTPCAA